MEIALAITAIVVTIVIGAWQISLANRQLKGAKKMPPEKVKADKLKNKKNNQSETFFNYKKAELSDLVYIYNLAIEILGKDYISPLDQMEELYQVDDHMFHIIRKENTSLVKGRTSINTVGYFSIVRLSSKGLKKIREDKSSGQKLEPTDIDPNSSNIYIGGMAGKNPSYTKGILMSNMILYLKNKIKDKKIKVIFARPITEDGKRLINKFNFSKETNSNNLYMKKDFSDQI